MGINKSEVHVTRRDIQKPKLEASDPDCLRAWCSRALFLLCLRLAVCEIFGQDIAN